ncbi:MAG: amino acid adenylation domain-containing protein [Acidobacteria bacterium]|nr:amino acid adenylation domain-containing protein [Acidobacteriota bacterium]
MLKEEPIQEGSVEAEDVFVFPASFAQQRLWLLDQLQPGDPAYNIAAGVRLRGQLNVAALRDSLSEVAQRHEALRTTFTTVDDELVQVVALSANVTLTIIELESLNESEREAEFQRLADEEAQKPFHLARGPLLRATLLRMAEQEHVLLLTMHHVISDGWSISVLIGEMSALYGSFSTGEPVMLSELPIQYADYAAWQRERLQGEVLETQLTYWKQRLSGAPGVLELPSDYTRPPMQTFRSATVSLELSETLGEALKELSRRRGITLFMTLLAAFKTLLYRYTGQEEIVLGTPIAGRDRAEVKGLIGFFLNTLVLRTELSGNPSFDELLERVRQTTVGAYAHQDLPFEKLLEELQPERDLSRTPLFQVFFNMLNLPEAEMSLPGMSVELLAPREVGSKFDLTLYVREMNRRVSFELVFNADLFSRERMSVMLGQFERLLEQAVENPGEYIGNFSLVTPASERILPRPAEPLNDDWLGAVPSIFSRHARHTPERTAILDEHETWSYGELDAHSNQLANYLRYGGIRNQDIVAIYSHRSSSLVWALLGVMKAGAAFVVLDPAYPDSRIIDYLQLAGPRGFIHLAAAGALPTALAGFVEGMACNVKLELPRRDAALARKLFAAYSTDGPDVSINPEDLAYISFTSGSTGRPKGVEGKHGSLTHFLPWLQKTFGLDETDRYTMLSGLAHDPLHRDIFTPLQLGACICIPKHEEIETPGRITEWMKRERVTITHLTPAMAQLLTETGSDAASCEVESLRYAFLVGDVLTRHDVARLRRLAPSITCINYYGSTETQRAVSYYRVDEDTDKAGASRIEARGRIKEILPLGKGIEDVQLLVLNRAGRLAGVGEAGEIYLRSPHIARGYMGDATLTQERFVENPFTKMPGDRLYRTGDIGRYMPDGNVEPLGRADHQVKIRGFRIELGEVEAVLGLHEGVREAVVIAREDTAGERRLVAYIVGEGVAAPASNELREFLKERLPDYMVPTAFVSIDALPLTPNKKVDRSALPAPAQAQGAKEASHVAARTPNEERLAGIWSQVLKQARVGIHDNFFELGGHSLLAIRLIARIRDEFNVELPLRDVFQSPTVAELVTRIEEMRKTKPLARVTSPQPVARDGALSLSFAQQRLWFVDQLDPGSPAYNIFAAVRLEGHFDAPALERSLNEIFRRHETLRTSFKVLDEEPLQAITPNLKISLQLIDLNEMPEAGRDAEVARQAEEESRQPFELTSAPLMRVKLLRLGEGEHVLLLTMHHIISDGWSVGVLLREMATLYEAFSNGRPSPLAELPMQYADFAHWQRERLRGEVLEAQLSYWRQQLEGAPSLMPLPTDMPRPPVQSFRGARRFRQFDSEIYEALKSLSLSEGVTIFTTLLAAFKTLLHRYVGQDDLVVGSPIAGRHLVETEGLIGFFANTLVLRSDLSGNPTFLELLGRVRETTLSAYAHQDMPFDKLVEVLQPKRHASYTPLFQVSFSLQTATEVLEVPGLSMRRLTVDNSTSVFDLGLNMKETDQGLSGTMEYSTDLFNPDTINRMLDAFETLLGNIVANPGARLRALEETLIEADRQNMSVEEEERKETFRRRLKNVERKKISVNQSQ